MRRIQTRPLFPVQTNCILSLKRLYADWLCTAYFCFVNAKQHEQRLVFSRQRRRKEYMILLCLHYHRCRIYFRLFCSLYILYVWFPLEQN